MKNYIYKFSASQENNELVMLEFNDVNDAMEFGSTFLECSPDNVEEPAFTIVRRERDKC